jgi:hypothetical protein
MSETVPLCGACGAAAFRTSGTCTVCHTHLPAATLLAPYVGDGLGVVCVVLSQHCLHCSATFVVHALADNASTTCTACAKPQTIAFAELRELLGHAHTASAHTPSKKDRSHDVASSLTVGRLQATIYRGHPLCDGCRAPLALAVAKDGTTATCTPCASTVRYGKHKIVDRAGAGAVVGVIAPFAATGRVDLAIAGDDNADVIALRCPGCAAPVEAADKRVIKCGHCDTIAWVPDRAWQAKAPKPPIWLVMRHAAPAAHDA